MRRLAAILGVRVSLPLAGTAGGATGFRDAFTKLRGSNIDAGVPSWSPQGLVAYTQAHGCGINVASEDGSRVRRLTRMC